LARWILFFWVVHSYREPTFFLSKYPGCWIGAFRAPAAIGTSKYFLAGAGFSAISPARTRAAALHFQARINRADRLSAALSPLRYPQGSLPIFGLQAHELVDGLAPSLRTGSPIGGPLASQPRRSFRVCCPETGLAFRHAHRPFAQGFAASLHKRTALNSLRHSL